MFWIKCYTDLRGHPKFNKLMNMLNVKSENELEGGLIDFWKWCIKYVEDGDLNKYAIEQIRNPFQSTVSSKEFVDSLITCGFIDEKTMYIHDWLDYVGDYLCRKYAHNKPKYEAIKAMYKKEPKENKIKPVKETKKEVKPKEPEEIPEIKLKYAEFVTMTEKEHNSLLSKFGEEITLKAIEILNNYKGSNGKKYKSDYLATLSWVIDKVKEKNVIDKKTDTNPDTEHLIRAYKILKGVDKNDVTWDAINKTQYLIDKVKALIDFCGNKDSAMKCLEDVSEEMSSKGLSWTFDTICKHADSWKNKRGDK